MRVAVALSLLLALTASAFNLDLPSAVHQFNADAAGMDFGASVAAYEDQGRPWLLAGAPRLSGQVFRCNVFRKSCTRVPIRSPRPPEFLITEQNLGMSVSAANKSWNSDGIAVMCAPRLQKSRSALNSTKGSLDAIGQCYAYLGGASKYTTISPCASQSDMGSCLAGLAASVNTDPAKRQIQLALGMPGAFVSEGNVFLGTYRENGEEVNQVMLKMRTGDWAHKGFGLGYSVLLTNLRPKEKTENDVITAAPMWIENGYRGVVLITDKNMQNEEATVIRDTFGHVGSFFGYSLAALDLDGDAILDLVVGAPFFSASGRTDVGRVYVLYGRSRRGGFAVRGNPVVLEGPKPDGRFGHALASLGDIDGDGLSDLGVGCPYCGEDGAGAVFIYLSRRGGMVAGNADQVIEASALNSNPRQDFTDDLEILLGQRAMPKSGPLATFGWALSGGADFDANSVPDLAVGARRADSVTVVRGKSTGRLLVVQNGTHAPARVQLDPRSCGPSGCLIEVSVALRLDAWPTTELRPFPFRLKFDFDALVPRDDQKRLRATEEPELVGPAVRVQRNVSFSRQPRRVAFRLAPLPRRVAQNRWQPLRISFTAEPLWSQSYAGPKRNALKPSQSPLPLVLRKDSLQNYSLPDIFIENRDCAGRVCRSDIYVRVAERKRNGTEQGVVYYGAREVRHLYVYVGNRGETAYNSKLKLTFPRGVHYVNFSPLSCTMLEEEQNSTSSSSDSAKPEAGPRTVLECQLPKVLRKITAVTRLLFAVQPSMAELSPELRRTREVRFLAEASSENPDVDVSNNADDYRFELRVFSNVSLSPSAASGDGVVIDKRNVSVRIQGNQNLYAETIGPEFRQVFRLVNFGPSPVARVDVNISLPLYSQSMRQLLYILSKVKEEHPGGGSFTEVSALPRLLGSDDAPRGTCSIDASYVDLYKLRVIRAARPSLLAHRRRRRSAGSGPRDPEPRRASFLTGWKSRQMEEVRCDRPSDEFGEIHCAQVHCTVHNLTRYEVVRIVVEARLWADTYFKQKTSDVVITTTATARLASHLDGLPVSGPLELPPLAVEQAFIFRGIQNLVTKQIPLWPVIVAIFCGILLLALIILAMWKCGFFKRHRPMDKEFAM